MRNLLLSVLVWASYSFAGFSVTVTEKGSAVSDSVVVGASSVCAVSLGSAIGSVAPGLLVDVVDVVGGRWSGFVADPAVSRVSGSLVSCTGGVVVGGSSSFVGGVDPSVVPVVAGAVVGSDLSVAVSSLSQKVGALSVQVDSAVSTSSIDYAVLGKLYSFFFCLIMLLWWVSYSSGRIVAAIRR